MSAAKRLEILIDFNHAPGMVTCWFRECSNGDPIPLHLQDLYNICCRLRRDRNDGWSAADATFFTRQLWPEVSKPHLLKANLQVVKLPPDRFARWVKNSDDAPARFVDRATGVAHASSLPTVSVFFELANQGKNTILSAMVDLPSGPSIPYRQLQYRPAGKSERYQFQQHVVALNCPLPRATMDELFAKSDPALPTELVAEHLPTLLQNELHRLRGSSVKTRGETGDVRLQIGTVGEEVTVTVRVGPARLTHLDQPPSVLERQSQSFVVTTFDSAGMNEAWTFLRSLPLSGDVAPFVMSANAESLAALARAKAALPAEICLEIDPKLANVLGQPERLPIEVVVDAGKHWLDVSAIINYGGQSIATADLNAAKNNNGRVRARSGALLMLPLDEIAEIEKELSELGLVLGQQRLSRGEGRALAARSKQSTRMQLARRSEEALRELAAEPPPLVLPREWDEVLRSYQLSGVEFLHQSAAWRVGCLLADDMGLGKTIQVLAWLSAYHANSQARSSASVVVCPASVLSVWRDEAARFAPELKVAVLSGSPAKRHQLIAEQAQWDLLVGTYAVMRNDQAQLQAHTFSSIILDEAQQIKNPDAEVTQAVKGLRCQQRIALSGTPLENRRRDLWSIMDFLNPGLFGDRQLFEACYDGSGTSNQRLARRLSPLMLRRNKLEVASELPPRIEELLLVPMTERQQERYQREQTEARKKVAQLGTMELLASITRLRQLCCHPDLPGGVDDPGAVKIADSAKLQALVDMLTELTEAGHSALVFSQFTQMLGIIAHALTEAGLTHFTITGETATQKRPEIVTQFAESANPAVMLLSLRAAGTGLTLTKADYVFLFDPWWNPAVEQQAIDRAHRIGQDKTVVAYRMVTAGSVEEKVTQLQAEKRALFAEIVDGAAASEGTLRRDDLLALLG